MMVAFSAGGVNDVVARQWAERVKTLLGTVYVENQGGGTGTIATGEVLRGLLPTSPGREAPGGRAALRCSAIE